MHIIAHEHSYDIIGQKSSISQKFLPPRAPLEYRQHLYFFSYFFHFYLFFQIFIKSTIFSNKNNNWCFWSSWPPKCCWLKWCCWGTSHPKITAPKQKTIRFFEQKIYWKSCIKCQNVKVYHIYYSKFKHMFFSQETTKCKTSTGNGIKIVNILYFS